MIKDTKVPNTSKLSVMKLFLNPCWPFNSKEYKDFDICIGAITYIGKVFQNVDCTLERGEYSQQNIDFCTLTDENCPD